jgi:hypothetical protein
MLAGCTDDTAELKQKIAELEKKVQQQQKDLSEFTGKLALPKDFSADIQRIEDQQDRISQVLKTKVDPVNTKLEEFASWARKPKKTEIWARDSRPWSSPCGSAKRVEAEGPRSGSHEQEVARARRTWRVLPKAWKILQKHW